MLGRLFYYMQQDTLASIQAWFEDYADGFIVHRSDRGSVPMVLKRAHTLRVADESESIARELGWPQEEIMLARAIALLHDIARFPQYLTYSTFCDPKSFNHGEKACIIMKSVDLLSPLEAHERACVLTCIRYHNRKEIPSGIDSRTLKQLHLIRDADKIDILASVSRILKEGWHHKHPGILLDVDMEGPLTDSLIQQLLEHNIGSYEHVNTLADIHLMRVAWVYSISYKPTLQRIVDRQLYQDAVKALPDTAEIREIIRRARDFIKHTLSSS